MINRSMNPTDDPIEEASGDAMKGRVKIKRRPGSDEGRSSSGDRGISPDKLVEMVSRAIGEVSALESGIFKMPRPGEHIPLKRFEIPPEGAKVKEGPRGGRYFPYDPNDPRHDEWLIRRRAHGGLGNVPEHLRENHPQARKPRGGAAAAGGTARPAAPSAPPGQLTLPGLFSPPRPAAPAPTGGRRPLLNVPEGGERRIYLRPGESPPKGTPVYTGPRGGRYYLYDPNNPAHDDWLLARREQVKEKRAAQEKRYDDGEEIILQPGQMHPDDMYVPGVTTRLEPNRPYQVRIGYEPPDTPAMGKPRPPKSVGKRVGFIKYDPKTRKYSALAPGRNEVGGFRTAEQASNWLIQMHNHASRTGHPSMYRSLDSLLDYSVAQANKAILLAEVPV